MEGVDSPEQQGNFQAQAKTESRTYSEFKTEEINKGLKTLAQTMFASEKGKSAVQPPVMSTEGVVRWWLEMIKTRGEKSKSPGAHWQREKGGATFWQEEYLMALDSIYLLQTYINSHLDRIENKVVLFANRELENLKRDIAETGKVNRRFQQLPTVTERLLYFSDMPEISTADRLKYQKEIRESFRANGLGSISEQEIAEAVGFTSQNTNQPAGRRCENLYSYIYQSLNLTVERADISSNPGVILFGHPILTEEQRRAIPRKTLEKARRRLMKEHHPDLAVPEKRGEATEVSSRINSAFSVLSNPEEFRRWREGLVKL